MARAVKNLQNPKDLRAFVQAWDKAISAADTHARRCRACNTRRHPKALALATGTLVSIDPYQPCPQALALHGQERAAMAAYRTAGGTLPIKR